MPFGRCATQFNGDRNGTDSQNEGVKVKGVEEEKVDAGWLLRRLEKSSLAIWLFLL